MKASLFSARQMSGLIFESYAEIQPEPIIVLTSGTGETDQDGRISLDFDEFGWGKVSFRAQLSVK